MISKQFNKVQPFSKIYEKEHYFLIAENRQKTASVCSPINK